jgi:hypothetical protein
MKRALSIAAVVLLAALAAGAMLLLSATVPPELVERSVVLEQALLEKAWRLPGIGVRPRGLRVEPVLTRPRKHC